MSACPGHLAAIQALGLHASGGSRGLGVLPQTLCFGPPDGKSPSQEGFVRFFKVPGLERLLVSSARLPSARTESHGSWLLGMLGNVGWGGTPGRERKQTPVTTQRCRLPSGQSVGTCCGQPRALFSSGLGPWHPVVPHPLLPPFLWRLVSWTLSHSHHPSSPWFCSCFSLGPLDCCLPEPSLPLYLPFSLSLGPVLCSSTWTARHH